MTKARKKRSRRDLPSGPRSGHTDWVVSLLVGMLAAVLALGVYELVSWVGGSWLVSAVAAATVGAGVGIVVAWPEM